MSPPLSYFQFPIFYFPSAVDTSDVSVSTTRSAWDQVSPSFPRDHTGTSTSTTSASADGDMQSLVQKAVDEALDKAQRQW